MLELKPRFRQLHRKGDCPERVSCGLLDVANGGHFVLSPEETLEARQYYEPDTAVLHTEYQTTMFLLCSFWLVENQAKQGRLDDAATGYASLCDRASPLGLLPEQIDPSAGGFIGNFPQAFSHIGVIASGVTLERAGGALVKYAR